jgi:AbrB family looped-hinge helix DNA binding protein
MATLSSKGQVTIPKSIRDYFALQKMDKLIFSLTSEDTLVVKPVKKSFLDFAGSVKPRKKPENFAKIREEVIKNIAREVAQEEK